MPSSNGPSFRRHDPSQTVLLPTNLDEWLPDDHLDLEPLLAGLTERRLDARVRAPWMPARYNLEDGFVQSTIEQANHLGEVIGVYWQHDRAPPKMTWIENTAPTSRA